MRNVWNFCAQEILPSTSKKQTAGKNEVLFVMMDPYSSRFASAGIVCGITENINLFGAHALRFQAFDTGKVFSYNAKMDFVSEPDKGCGV